jgi:hypothetical protein
LRKEAALTQQPISDEQRDLVISMARTGQGRNQIARIVGLGAGTVTKIVTEAGLSFDRKATAAATKTRKIELAEKRSQLELDYLNDAQRLRRLLWQPYTYRELGTFADGPDKYSRFVEYVQATPTPQDQERLMRASAQAAQQSQRIADSAADQNTDAAKSMLAGLQEALGVAWKEMQAADG